MTNISVFAGDLRQQYINDNLSNKGYLANYVYSFEPANVYIVPIPFTRDNININTCFRRTLSINDFLLKLKKDDLVFSCNIPTNFKEEAAKKNIICIDYNDCTNFILLNSYLTAEGFLSTLIDTTPYSIKDIKLLILGYGKCGKSLALILNQFTQNIFIYDHTRKNLERANDDGFIPCSLSEIKHMINNYDVIINTVPSPILSDIDLSNSSPDCIFYEIASYPFGFRTNIFEEHNRRLITCAGLPGKYSPLTAARHISNIILEIIERNTTYEH